MFGPLADRFGRKPVILFGLVSLTVITPLISIANSFTSLVILRGIQGFVASTFAPSALAYAFDVLPQKRLVTTIGFISFGYVTSGIFGQVLADLLYQWNSWNMVFIVFGGLYFITFVASVLWLPNPGKPMVKKGITYYLHHSKGIFRQRNFQLIYLITSVLLLTFMGMYTLLGSFLSSEPFFLSDKEILGIRAIGIMGMLISPFVGMVVRKFGVLRTLRVGLGCAAMGLFFLGIGHGVTFVVFMSIIYVFGISLIFPSIMVLIGELGGDKRALANAFYAFILFLGAMLGPIVALYLFNISSYFITFFLLAVLLVIGLIFSIFIVYQEEP
ncbi:MFS transporter [Ornithinibacillus scapharcae]|uniref:MFS transporter n=1 Tax=Ornithinibacillus scapharcae TaxID=1147159 RepID=UPI000225C00C|nr:MFS transporter [Ornithinibacillus scapharcae]